jgi:NodT family efflux transporter outer membrane factor (OMF) lipoprotein
MTRLILVSVHAAFVASAIAGCTVGPDFNRPKPPGVSGYTAEPLAPQTASAQVAGGEAQSFSLGRDIAQQWWTLFRCPELNAVIEQALKANPDMQVAQAALRQAMELVYAQQGFYYPTIQAGVAASRQQNAVGTLAPTLTSGAPLFNLYTAEVGVSYTLDAFGANRRQVESLKAQAEFERFQLEATYLTLTSNVVVAAVQEASLRAQIAATEQVIQIETEVVQIFRRQHELGAIAMADVVAQEATLGQLQATLPALQKQLAQQRDLLARLAGRFPSEEPAQRFELSKLQLPQELPVSLPSKLIEQRPDVRAAEAQLHSASAQVGVAIANMLPQITLSAGAGTSATQVSQWFLPGNQFWLLGASLTQTLFDGGTLLHRKRAAEAALDQAGAQYRASVLTAFQNVADTLRALQYDADALKAQVAAEHAASESLAIARKALDLGSISYLSLLNAEQTYEQTLISLVQAKANRYADTAALFQALGGGWWNRPSTGALASSAVGEKRTSP